MSLYQSRSLLPPLRADVKLDATELDQVTPDRIWFYRIRPDLNRLGPVFQGPTVTGTTTTTTIRVLVLCVLVRSSLVRPSSTWLRKVKMSSRSRQLSSRVYMHSNAAFLKSRPSSTVCLNGPISTYTQPNIS
ncbi:hypothetical protein FQN60_005625 [Etheostoma spectabile]|uniref:Uncharacterized protein n=1 Tax=Etheostoma spectabile TaxID=54343 RepID=A0A5J5CIN3_9PERO|nr:hypothetical protein FQN60_005625 [Etheostoma spectabile]